MNVAHYAALFFGGMFLFNTLPHLAAGVMGRPFQSPFATPRGEGLSSSTVNVLWAFFNLVVAWWLLARVGNLDLREGDSVLVAGVGGLAISLFAARHFGRFHGGNTPT
jgi:hypothetical protein